MKLKLFTTTFCLLICIFSFSQNLHLNVFGGMANYEGDLQPKRFTFNQSHAAFGVGGEYELSSQFWLRAQATFGKISGDDKLYTQHASRNLNFTSKISEYQLVGQYLFRSLEDYRFTPYVFGGVAVFHFNPYTNDSAGTKYYLRPLSTEGEGIVDGKKTYNLTQFSLPFGAGLKINASNRFIVGFEVGFRKTFTDYLDDVSGSYIDRNTLLAARGTKAVELAYRGGELKNGATYPPAGTIRGNAARKDLYYFAGVTLTFKLGNVNGGSGDKKGIPCPSNKDL